MESDVAGLCLHFIFPSFPDEACGKSENAIGIFRQNRLNKFEQKLGSIPDTFHVWISGNSYSNKENNLVRRVSDAWFSTKRFESNFCGGLRFYDIAHLDYSDDFGDKLKNFFNVPEKVNKKMRFTNFINPSGCKLRNNFGTLWKYVFIKPDSLEVSNLWCDFLFNFCDLVIVYKGRFFKTQPALVKWCISADFSVGEH